MTLERRFRYTTVVAISALTLAVTAGCSGGNKPAATAPASQPDATSPAASFSYPTSAADVTPQSDHVDTQQVSDAVAAFAGKYTHGDHDDLVGAVTKATTYKGADGKLTAETLWDELTNASTCKADGTVTDAQSKQDLDKVIGFAQTGLADLNKLYLQVTSSDPDWTVVSSLVKDPASAYPSGKTDGTIAAASASAEFLWSPGLSNLCGVTAP